MNKSCIVDGDLDSLPSFGPSLRGKSSNLTLVDGSVTIEILAKVSIDVSMLMVGLMKKFSMERLARNCVIFKGKRGRWHEWPTAPYVH